MRFELLLVGLPMVLGFVALVYSSILYASVTSRIGITLSVLSIINIVLFFFARMSCLLDTAWNITCNSLSTGSLLFLLFNSLTMILIILYAREAKKLNDK